MDLVELGVVLTLPVGVRTRGLPPGAVPTAEKSGIGIAAGCGTDCCSYELKKGFAFAKGDVEGSGKALGGLGGTVEAPSSGWVEVLKTLLPTRAWRADVQAARTGSMASARTRCRISPSNHRIIWYITRAWSAATCSVRGHELSLKVKDAKRAVALDSTMPMTRSPFSSFLAAYAAQAQKQSCRIKGSWASGVMPWPPRVGGERYSAGWMKGT
jgi:hypothetical protein